MEFMAKYHYGKLLDDPWVENRIISTLQIINDHCITNGYENISLLDFGGYDGNLLSIHNSLKLNIISDYLIIDGDHDALNSAQKKGYSTKYLNLNTLPNFSPDKKFDCIVATEVLEHLINPNEILDCLLDYLKPTGFIVISLPNENTIVHRCYSLLGIGPDTEAFNLYKHLHLPTLQQAKFFLMRHLEIRHTKNWFHFGGNGSKITFIGFRPHSLTGKVLTSIGNLFPNLLARGRIYLCSPKRTRKKILS